MFLHLLHSVDVVVPRGSLSPPSSPRDECKQALPIKGSRVYEVGVKQTVGGVREANRAIRGFRQIREGRAWRQNGLEVLLLVSPNRRNHAHRNKSRALVKPLHHVQAAGDVVATLLLRERIERVNTTMLRRVS